METQVIPTVKSRIKRKSQALDNEIGRRSFLLVVVSVVWSEKDNRWMLNCRCDCGDFILVKPGLLGRGSKSCGFCSVKHGNVVGKRFGILLVQERSREVVVRWERTHSLYKCLCDCGKVVVLAGYQLLKTKRVSCGCMKGIRLKKGESGLSSLMHSYRHGAIDRNLDFNLNRDDMKRLTSSDCHYCGTPPHAVRTWARSKSHHGDYVYNGIDRFDNSKGYTLENSVPCCWRCNNMKQTMAGHEFVRIASVIAMHAEPEYGMSGC